MSEGGDRSEGQREGIRGEYKQERGVTMRERGEGRGEAGAGSEEWEATQTHPLRTRTTSTVSKAHIPLSRPWCIHPSYQRHNISSKAHHPPLITTAKLM